MSKSQTSTEVSTGEKQHSSFGFSVKKFLQQPKAFEQLTVLFFSCAMMCLFSVVNFSIKVTTRRLQQDTGLSPEKTQMVATSSTHILGMPLCVLGVLLLQRMGESFGFVLCTLCGAIGWLLFAFAVGYDSPASHGAFAQMVCGRLLQGGTYHLFWVTVNCLSCLLFDGSAVSFAMMAFKSAYCIGHIVAAQFMPLFFSTDDANANSQAPNKRLSVIYKYAAALYVAAFGCALVVVWRMHALAKWKAANQQTMRKVRVPEIKAQSVTHIELAARKSSIEETGELHVSCQSFSTTLSTTESTENAESNGKFLEIAAIHVENKEQSDECEKATTFWNYLRQWFADARQCLGSVPFVFAMLSSVLCVSTGMILMSFMNQILAVKYRRNALQNGSDMSLTKYLGLCAPLFGLCNDSLPQWLRPSGMLLGSLSLVAAHWLLLAGDYKSPTALHQSALLLYSFGQSCFGSAFWPFVYALFKEKEGNCTVAEVRSRKEQVQRRRVAFGLLGFSTAVSCLVFPMLFANVTKAEKDSESKLLFILLLMHVAGFCTTCVSIASHACLGSN